VHDGAGRDRNVQLTPSRPAHSLVQARRDFRLLRPERHDRLGLDEGRLDFITCDRLTTLRREAMSGKHRFGNFVLSLTTRVLFGVPVRDSQSGMWVFRREVLKDLTLTADGMPFSEELKVEAFRARRGRCLEVPIEYRVRIGEAVLSTWSDGFHNLAFLFGKRFGRPKGTRGELYGAPQP